MASHSKKDKNIAALLAFLAGFIGIHRFYLGRIGSGILYLLFAWTGIPAIIAFIEFFVLIFMKDEEFNRKYNKESYQEGSFDEEFSSVSRPKKKYKKKQALLNKLRILRENINQNLKSSDNYTKEVINDISPIMNKYMTQVQDLLERDEKLENILSQNSIKDISFKISELQEKAENTSSTQLKNEYNKAIKRHKKRKLSMQEFTRQRELINLRVQEIEMSFEQLQYDLVKVETLNKEEQRKELNAMFKERSDDLGNYLEALKSTYDDIDE